MKCPLCGNKLRCQDSREADLYTTIREYGCVRCSKVFLSIEQLDKESMERKPTKSLTERYKDEREKSLCGEQVKPQL